MPQAANRSRPKWLFLPRLSSAFARRGIVSEVLSLPLDMPEVSRCLNLVQLKFSEMAADFAKTDEYDSPQLDLFTHLARDPDFKAA